MARSKESQATADRFRRWLMRRAGRTTGASMTSFWHYHAHASPIGARAERAGGPWPSACGDHTHADIGLDSQEHRADDGAERLPEEVNARGVQIRDRVAVG